MFTYTNRKMFLYSDLSSNFGIVCMYSFSLSPIAAHTRLRDQSVKIPNMGFLIPHLNVFI